MPQNSNCRMPGLPRQLSPFNGRFVSLLPVLDHMLPAFWALLIATGRGAKLVAGRFRIAFRPCLHKWLRSVSLTGAVVGLSFLPHLNQGDELPNVSAIATCFPNYLSNTHEIRTRNAQWYLQVVVLPYVPCYLSHRHVTRP